MLAVCTADSSSSANCAQFLTEKHETAIITASQNATEMSPQSAEILLRRIANANEPVQQRFLKAALLNELR